MQNRRHLAVQNKMGSKLVEQRKDTGKARLTKTERIT